MKYNYSSDDLRKMLVNAGFKEERVSGRKQSQKHIKYVHEASSTMTCLPKGDVKGKGTLCSILKAIDSAVEFDAQKAAGKLENKRIAFRKAMQKRTQELKDLRNRARKAVKDALKADVDIDTVLTQQGLNRTCLNKGI